MGNMGTAKRRKGFTLVELIIVLVIMAVLTAIIIPQLRESKENARLAVLDTNLSVMRSAIEVYYAQHRNTYPGVIKTHTSGGPPLPHLSPIEAFTAQMTKFSDADGNTNDVRDSVTFIFGPYAKKGIPKNPFPNSATLTDDLAKSVYVDVITTVLGSATAVDLLPNGWYFVRATGEFFANNTAYDDR